MFLGAFAKLRKAIISVVVSVRPSIVNEISAPTRQIFMEFDRFRVFRKLVEIITILLKSDKNNR